MPVARRLELPSRKTHSRAPSTDVWRPSTKGPSHVSLAISSLSGYSAFHWPPHAAQGHDGRVSRSSSLFTIALHADSSSARRPPPPICDPISLAHPLLISPHLIARRPLTAVYADISAQTAALACTYVFIAFRIEITAIRRL
jgi:hypothetical protein